MTPSFRKLVISVHLTFSVGWIGAATGYIGRGVAAVRSQDDAIVRAAWTAMELTGWFVIVPLAVLSLLTGVVMAIGTKWGLLRHSWVVISFVLTIFSVVILVLHMPSVSATAEIARTAEGAALQDLGGDLGHPTIGVAILLVVQVLNVYKPRGMTRYGWRKQHELGAS